MIKGQVIAANTEYEIYAALRRQVSVKDFVEGQLVCCRFLYSSEDECFVLDRMCISPDLDKIYDFQEELSHEGFYCILDAHGDVEEITYGGREFVTIMRVTDMASWTILFEFNGDDARYEKYLREQAFQSFKSVRKLPAS